MRCFFLLIIGCNGRFPRDLNIESLVHILHLRESVKRHFFFSKKNVKWFPSRSYISLSLLDNEFSTISNATNSLLNIARNGPLIEITILISVFLDYSPFSIHSSFNALFKFDFRFEDLSLSSGEIG